MKQVVHNLLAPASHLFLISKYLPESEMQVLAYNLINQDYLEIFEYLDSKLKEIMSKDMIYRNEDDLYLSILISNFKESIREIYIDYQHLEYHFEESKSLSIFKIVENTLAKYNITNSNSIAKEVYEELFINNLKKDKDNGRDNDRKMRNLKKLNQYAKATAKAKSKEG
ncbi:hypothetical protein KO02_19485 [Sphingobacterium sp. ML3W]|uniref:hypothetical protein n=1 Tax=Sphingobacterium sp. ML3W TaxID=1538644 RepID=UPI0004F59DD6|nr:hypothetical protein [Sphingobacterium sp. ML3W]AIM38634.1 hypothetical protein KO02_19485 [Sphingobacterium sp. ML3W]